MENTYTAFDGSKLLSKGSLDEVVLKIKKRLGKEENNPYLIFSDDTGQTIDFNFRGTEKDVQKRLEVFITEKTTRDITAGPGRPKLGVVSREISLLPRQWEWLSTQPGGASSTLRKLVEEAKKKHSLIHPSKQAQERTYKFMSIMAGDLVGYEEALRALYKKERKIFLSYIEAWPADLRIYIAETSKEAF
jgi:uncharacterized protein